MVTDQLRIGIAVHGRFHAFDLARGLLQNGHQVTLLTNYPGSVVERFGVPRAHVSSLVRQGIGARAANRILGGAADRWVNPWFGRWAARELARHTFDVTHVWSGVAAEWLEACPAATRCTLARGSAHIRTQRQLLEEEEERAGVRLEKPSNWTVEREEQEYARAGVIVVPSRFAYDSFLKHGVPAQRLRLVPLPAAPVTFRAGQNIIDERLQRITRGTPLRILFVGAISYQKGMLDLLHLLEQLPASKFQFRLVGPLTRECSALSSQLRARAELIGKVPQSELPAHYAWADLLILPSIQDGFAVVLSQAAAAGVPFVASRHSGAPDLVAAGLPGWIIEPREPEQLRDCLLSADADRAELARRVCAVHSAAGQRDWKMVAEDFVREVVS